MPEDCKANGFGWRWSLPLTVEWVSLPVGVRQAFGGRDRVELAQAFALEIDAMSAVDDAVQDRVAQGRIADASSSVAIR
jgi:hypothetical protein